MPAKPLTERDPRVDPRPGDVLLFKAYPRPFTVLEVESDGGIIGRFTPSKLKRGSLCRLLYWREVAAKNAEVLHVAK